MRFCQFLASFIIASLVSLAVSIESDAAQGGRPWTVQDSVAVRYFVTNFDDPASLHSKEFDPPPFRFSPDGKHFFFQSFHGDSSTDRMIYELWVYSVADVQRALADDGSRETGSLSPRKRLVMQSGFSGPYSAAAIYLPLWETDRTITFVGTTDRQARQVYRYDIGSGKLTALTDPQYILSEDGGLNYWIRGDSIIFEIDGIQPRDPKNYPVSNIGSDALEDLFDPHKFFVYQASYKGTASKTVAEAELRGRFGPWISPDEKWAVMLYSPKNSRMPAEWDEYTFDAPPVRFMLINLQTGLNQPVLNSPAGPRDLWFEAGTDEVWGAPYAAFWSNDAKHVLLFNTALPLAENAPQRRNDTYVIDYDVETNQWSVVDLFPAGRAHSADKPLWIEEGRRLLVVYRSEKRKVQACKIFRFEGKRWTVSPHCPKTLPKDFEGATDLKLSLRESANDPPMVIASNEKNEIALTGFDPALEGVWRAPIEAIDWHDPNGQPVEALLMLPRGFSKAKPVRLVIQLSDGSNPADMFWPDGEVGTGFAAQALVSQGFSVLQLEPAGFHRSRSVGSISLTPKEGPAQVRRVDEAIEVLRQRGIVIDGPIGLIGFSRTGYHVYYVATHPGRTRIGAVVAFDSLSYGYGEYVNGVALEGTTEEWTHDSQYGGNFWQNKQAWLDAPAFNLDKLKAPILFCVAGGDGIGRPLDVAETIGAFRASRRPFDYQWYPDSPHPLAGAGPREAALQSTVDWMSFWLQGREREGSDAVERFARWRKIKADWEKVQTQEAAKSASVSAP